MNLSNLHHVSLKCGSIKKSSDFYIGVLGFIEVKRPTTLTIQGAWLFGHGVGIHLLHAPELEDAPKKDVISPKDNHISFQSDDIEAVEEKLKESNIKYLKTSIEEGGIKVDQVFFHDPDNFMIEICTCDHLPVVPLN